MTVPGSHTHHFSPSWFQPESTPSLGKLFLLYASESMLTTYILTLEEHYSKTEFSASVIIYPRILQAMSLSLPHSQLPLPPIQSHFMVKTLRSRILHLEVPLLSMLWWCSSLWSQSHRSGNPFSFLKALILGACCLWLVAPLDSYFRCHMEIKRKVCLKVKQAWTVAAKSALQGLEDTSELSPGHCQLLQYLVRSQSQAFLPDKSLVKPAVFTPIIFIRKKFRALLLPWLETIS